MGLRQRWFDLQLKPAPMIRVCIRVCVSVSVCVRISEEGGEGGGASGPYVLVRRFDSLTPPPYTSIPCCIATVCVLCTERRVALHAEGS